MRRRKPIPFLGKEALGRLESVSNLIANERAVSRSMTDSIEGSLGGGDGHLGTLDQVGPCLSKRVLPSIACRRALDP